MFVRWSYGSFVVLLLLAVTAGMAAVGTRLEPTVFGLPPAVLWSGVCVVASFVGLLVYDVVTRGDSKDDS